MAKGFLNISHSVNGSIDYYGRDGECIGWRHSNKNLKDYEDVKQDWKEIEQNEKLGNKELGIRGRHDARVRTNYVLSLPNTLSVKEAAEKVQSIIDQTEIKNCTYTMFLHRGEKDKVKNLHMHLIVNERNLGTGKKDRTMQRKEWLEKTFRPLYEKTFKNEFEQTTNKPRRERVPVGLYQSDTKEAKNQIQGIYGGLEEKENVLPTQEEAKKMGGRDYQIWLDFVIRAENRKKLGVENSQTWGEYKTQRAEMAERAKIEAENKAMKREKRPGLGL
jgi:hypothetical protein